MCNATVNRFGLGLGSDRREWCCRCCREWFGAVANGSHRRDWVWVQIVVANGSESSSRMVQTVANGSDRRREWFGAVVANGSDHRREWFRPPSVVANGSDRRCEWFRPPSVVANGSEPSRMVQTIVANGSDRRREWFGAVANGSDRRE
ncbi:hypothetical protein RGQ29_006627 [Quercus rubra]|uniref:Uncharacterized protein n=1 Tax=Quercus rubra TaxID=3512 RepID=A0AAN7E7Q3_QUERU|nr:hypothetical protein RGQ29_006627 [Quercus rubra]